MKKIIYLITAILLFCCLINKTQARTLEIGAKFPIDKLSQEKTSAETTIVAFIPSLTFDCDYASMLTQSFYYYFDRKLAFEGLKKSPATQIFLVVRDRQDESKSTQNILGGMKIIFDDKGALFKAFDVNQPATKNADSTLILLDSNNTITHIDKNYRAQGEHLKPLESKIKELNGIREKVKKLPISKALKIGDTAPDFRINEKSRLSNLRGRVVLISFYPAAFSGTLPKPVESLPLKSDNPFALDNTKIMSCTTQVTLLDIIPKSKFEAKRIVISSSTNSLLNKWQEVLGTHNIEYTNDADYSISSKYFSYNSNGYNNRVSVIIDQKGKIAFIDKNFDFNDESIINAKIDELLNAKNH